MGSGSATEAGDMRRNNKPRHLHDAAIEAILKGVHRSGSGQRYFKIAPDGKHRWFSVRKEMDALGVGHPSLTRLLREAVESGLVEVSKFDNGKRKPVPRVKKQKPDRDRPAKPVKPRRVLAPKLNPQPSPKLNPRPRPKPKAKPEPEPQLEPDDEEEVPSKEKDEDWERDNPMGLGDISADQLKRYELVKRGHWYGFVDLAYDHIKLVSEDREEVLEEIYRLRREGADSVFRFPSFNHSSAIA
jgi:hypothetical protein